MPAGLIGMRGQGWHSMRRMRKEEAAWKRKLHGCAPAQMTSACTAGHGMRGRGRRGCWRIRGSCMCQASKPPKPLGCSRKIATGGCPCRARHDHPVMVQRKMRTRAARLLVAWLLAGRTSACPLSFKTAFGCWTREACLLPNGKPCSRVPRNHSNSSQKQGCLLH